MKFPILFFALVISISSSAQSLQGWDEKSEEKIQEACAFLQWGDPIMYEAIVNHTVITKNPDPSYSTYLYDRSSGNLWIFLGNVYDVRSSKRLAGTIFHESLHLMLEIQRIREGDFTEYKNFTNSQKKQEEIFIYKKTRELLTKIGAPSWEIKEHDQLMERVRNQD